MRNIAPAQLINRQRLRFFQLAAVIVSAGIFLAMFGLALYALPSVFDDGGTLYDVGRVGLMFGGVILCIIGAGIGLWTATNFRPKKENKLAQIMGNALRHELSAEFTFIRGINQLGIGYVDAVLVGTPGVMVFRLLDWTGEFLNESSHWVKKNNQGHWLPTRTNPTREVVDDINALKAHFADEGLEDIPIYGMIVFVKENTQARISLKDPVVPATHLRTVYPRLNEHFLGKERIRPKTVKIIVDLLYENI